MVSHLTQPGRDLNKSEPLSKPHDSNPTFIAATKANAIFSTKQQQETLEASRRKSDSTGSWLLRQGPGVISVVSSRMNVSDKRHLVRIEIERNRLAIRLSSVAFVIII